MLKISVVLSFLIVWVISPSTAQEGFKKEYDFGGLITSVHQLLVKEDTLVLIGNTLTAEPNQVGVLFAKLDTLGNVLSQRIIYDTLYGGSFVFNVNFEAIATSDGGYLIPGVLFYTPFQYFLLKLTVDGEVEFIQHLDIEETVSVFPMHPIEVEDGYLVAGTSQVEFGGTFNGQFFVNKYDLQGNLQWNQFYGMQALEERSGTFIELHPNLFVLAGSRSNAPLIDDPDTYWTRAHILAIDSTGAFQWNWQGPNNEESYISNLLFIEDEGWIYTTSELEFEVELYYGFRTKVVCRDLAFEKKWEHPLSTTAWQLNGTTELIYTKDHSLVTVGRWILPNAPTPYPDSVEVDRWSPTNITKLSMEGDSLWSRLDTMEIGVETSGHYLNTATILSSGSVVAAGNFDDNSVGKQKVWVIKVGKDGCLGDSCNLVSSTPFVRPPAEETRVYPNPASQDLYVDFGLLPQGPSTLQILNSQGVVMLEKSLAAGQSPLQRIDTARYPAGVYFYRLLEAGTLISVGQFLVVD